MEAGTDNSIPRTFKVGREVFISDGYFTIHLFFIYHLKGRFSKWGQILSERRSSIQPKRMEKILFLNMNQRFLKFFLRKCRDEQVTNGLILFKVCFYFIMFNFSPRTKVSRQEYGVTMSGT